MHFNVSRGGSREPVECHAIIGFLLFWCRIEDENDDRRVRLPLAIHFCLGVGVVGWAC